MKPRPDSYEASLTDEQREELHALLLSPELSLAAVRKLAPNWVGGPRDGAKPSIGNLSQMAARLRREQMLVNVEAKAKLMEAVRAKALEHAHELESGQTLEQLIDVACNLVGQEVLQKTMADEDPKNRTAALRALLKRADQKRFDQQFKEKLKTDLERGLEALYQHIKGIPAAVKAFNEIQATVQAATK